MLIKMMARLVYKEDMLISEHFGSDSRVKLILLIYRVCSETCGNHEEFTSGNFVYLNCIQICCYPKNISGKRSKFVKHTLLRCSIQR